MNECSDNEMAIWPFGRKSKKKIIDLDNQSMGVSKNNRLARARRETGSESAEVNPPVLGRRLSRRESQRRHRNASKKLTKAQNSRMKDVEKTEPTPSVAALSSPTVGRFDKPTEKAKGRQMSTPPNDRGDVPSYYFQNPTSLSSLQPENFNAVPLPPTLRVKRSANDSNLPRRKSSKRKADDHAREQEIKAMSSPIPIPKRPTSHTSGILARDSRKVPSGLNRNLERPLSDISLPIPESLHSAMSVISDSHGFKVSAFDVLSPRPTIRHFENPRHKDVGSGSFGPSRSSTKKERQQVIPEEALKSKKRVDELADELDAGSLRELMERDRRRCERNRKSDQEKLQQRLQRKADKQRAADNSREEINDGSSKENINPKVMDQRDIGLGIARATTAPALDHLSFAEEGTRSPESWTKDAPKERIAALNYFKDIHVGGAASPIDTPTPIDEPDEPILETAKAVRLSQASMSPPTSPNQQPRGLSSLSQLSDLGSRSTPDIPERQGAGRRDSDTSGRLSSNWTSIFRRSGTRAKRGSADRGRAPPLEFSNTSRESFARQMPPSVFTRIPPARSGTPIRTQSRFREDLPELPLSPPDSRVQSPEVTEQTHLIPDERMEPRAPTAMGGVMGLDHPLTDIHPAFREQVALSRHQSVNSPTSEVPSSAVLSRSLASVDSEGSWLTGRPVKRSSQTLVNPLRGSATSLQKRLRELGASDEDLEIVGRKQEHEFHSIKGQKEDPLSGQTQTRRYINATSGVGAESDDDSVLQPHPTSVSQDEGKWHSAPGKHPTIIRQSTRAKSREGLLNDFQAAEDSTESSPSADSPIGQPFADQATLSENSLIYRATSVDLGKGHARHISAGSARLLNLPPRSSGELKRLSTGSGERSPLSARLPIENEDTRASDVD